MPTLRFRSARVLPVISLWPHQIKLIEDTKQRLKEGHRRILNVLPTGGGKGTTAAEISRLTVQAGNQSLFIVHRREIILDQAARLRKLGLHVGVILPGHGRSPYADVQVASTSTLLNRMDTLPDAHLINIDEAHHYALNSWAELINAYPNSPIVGWTATPERGDGKPLDNFQCLNVGATYSELIRQGLIVPCKVYQPSEHMGSDLALDPVAAYQFYAPDTKGFCFVPTLELAYQTADRFNLADIPAIVVDGKTPKRTRDRAVSDLQDGYIKMIVNYNTMTEGVDVASAQTCILARRCHHTGTYLQGVGRVLRAFPGKWHAILLDLVGASIVHGLPHIDREYSLAGRAISASDKKAPIKRCSECSEENPLHALECEMCGWAFERKPRKEPEIFSEPLVSVGD